MYQYSHIEFLDFISNVMDKPTIYLKEHNVQGR